MWPHIASGALISLLGVVWMVRPDQEVNETAAKLETTPSHVFDSLYSHPEYGPAWHMGGWGRETPAAIGSESKQIFYQSISLQLRGLQATSPVGTGWERQGDARS